MCWGENMEMDITWIEEAGLDMKTGMEYTGGPDKFISAVQRYFRNYEKNRAMMEEYYAQKDHENFKITVHALKSNSKMIGATALSGLFETLEAAAGSKDEGVIEELTPRVLKDYENLVEKLKPAGEMGDVRAADEISGEIAKETAEKLLDALDDFDSDLAAELVKKLSGYPFRMTQAKMLKEAAGYIDDFLYDEAADIIRQITPEIE